MFIQHEISDKLEEFLALLGVTISLMLYLVQITSTIYEVILFQHKK